MWTEITRPQYLRKGLRYDPPPVREPLPPLRHDAPPRAKASRRRG